MRHSLIKVVSFEYAGAHSMRLQFADGYVTTIDFSTVLSKPLFQPLQDVEVFRRARIDPQAGTLVWPNGADFDPDTLYHWNSVSSTHS